MDQKDWAVSASQWLGSALTDDNDVYKARLTYRYHKEIHRVLCTSSWSSSGWGYHCFHMKQYMPGKPTELGIKAWGFSHVCNVYQLKCQISQGEKGNQYKELLNKYCCKWRKNMQENSAMSILIFFFFFLLCQSGGETPFWKKSVPVELPI